MKLRELLQKIGLSARPPHVRGDEKGSDDTVDDKFATSWEGHRELDSLTTGPAEALT